MPTVTPDSHRSGALPMGENTMKTPKPSGVSPPVWRPRLRCSGPHRALRHSIQPHRSPCWSGHKARHLICPHCADVQGRRHGICIHLAPPDVFRTGASELPADVNRHTDLAHRGLDGSGRAELADRLERRRLMMVTLACAMLLAFVLAAMVLAGTAPPGTGACLLQMRLPNHIRGCVTSVLVLNRGLVQRGAAMSP